jgi:hypothetical protein
MKPENIEKQIKEMNFRAGEDLHKKILDDALKAQQQSKQTNSVPAGLNFGRIIMKSPITKLAAAAVIVITIIGGISLWPGGSTNKWWLEPQAVWGQEILRVLDTIEVVTCRERTVIVTADGSEFPSSTWDKFYVSADSYRRDIYDGNFLREIQWYVPDGNDMVQHYIRFDLKCYGAVRHRGSFGIQDPVERMRFYVRLFDKADKLLKEKNVDGYHCIGFEINAGKYGNNPENWVDHIWFDVETKLPVYIEQHGRPVTDQPDKTFSTIQDQFNYNPQLPANTFVPWVPENFIKSNSDEILDLREKEEKE